MEFEKHITTLAAPAVCGLQPYLPGKPLDELEREYGIKDSIKLASNENPLGPSPQAVAAMQAALTDAWLYPDGSAYHLKEALAERHGVDASWITIGNGSNDVLVMLAEAFLTPACEAIYSQYAFAAYPIAVQATGATARVAPANPAEHSMPLGHDLKAMAALVNEKTRLVFIANPNNPTGTWVAADTLQGFVERLPSHTLVVVDEAYFDYVEDEDYPDTSTWVRQYPNLIVTRTFSKAHALAGLRVGYSVSRPETANLLNRVRQPFNVNELAQVAALAALRDTQHVLQSRELNAHGLRQIGAGLSQLGFDYLPSVGNFLLVDMGAPADRWYEALLRQGVIVRPVANYGLPKHLRITVGLPEQNARLLESLGSIQAARRTAGDE